MKYVKSKVDASKHPESLYRKILLDFKKGHARRNAICMIPDFLLRYLSKKALPEERSAFLEHIHKKYLRYIQEFHTISVKLKNPVMEHIVVLKEDISKLEGQISQPVPTTNFTIRQRRMSENEKARKYLEELNRHLIDAEEKLASIDRTYHALTEEAESIKNTISKAYLKGGTP